VAKIQTQREMPHEIIGYRDIPETQKYGEQAQRRDFPSATTEICFLFPSTIEAFSFNSVTCRAALLS
jgi:hypothetical protein